MLVSGASHHTNRTRSGSYVIFSHLETKRNEEFLRKNYRKMKASEIARILGVSLSMVHTKARRMNLTLPKQDCSVFLPVMLELRNQGKTVRDISTIVGVSESTAWKWLKRHKDTIGAT